MTPLGVRFKQSSFAPPEGRSHVSETSPAENASGTATALAEPPQPPTTPPGAVGSATPEPRRKRTGVILAVVLGLVAIGFVAVVVFLVMNSNKSNEASLAAKNAAYDSAMQKAGVQAPYPGAPVALTDVTATGSHPFEATFTTAEVAALLSTFPYESDVAGVQVSLQDVTLSVPEAGTVQIDAAVTANGGTYNGSVTLPLTYSGGRVESTGVTGLSVEGIPGNEGQKAQVGGALVNYFNAYISAAPGLTIESATLGADGVTVTGTAPDSLTFP